MKYLAIIAVGAALANAPLAQGDSTSYTPAGGYFTMNVQGGTDNHVSLPLMEKAVAFGSISDVSQDKVTARTKNWTDGGFRYVAGSQNATYYAEFASGALAGVRYRILDNTEDTLLLDTQGDDLTAHRLGAVNFGDVVRIRPLWTVGKVFGATESEVVLTPKPNALIPGDSVLLYDDQSVGQNKAPNTEIAFVHGLGWRVTGDLSTDQTFRAFEPGQPLIVRRRSSQSVNVAIVGYALTGAQSMYVQGGDGTSANDAYVSVLFPEAVTLNNSGLYNVASPSTSVVLSSSNSLIPGDQLLAYGNDTGFNSAPVRAFFYLNGAGWREVGNASVTTGDDFALQPGQAYIIRKRANHLGCDWVQGVQN